MHLATLNSLLATPRANAVEQALFERQHESLRVLLFRDVLHRLESTGVRLDDAQRSALNDAWNERDLIEFWAIQHERAKALRLIGVDAKLYSAQSVIDLLIKSVEARADRIVERIAADAGRRAGSSPDAAPVSAPRAADDR